MVFYVLDFILVGQSLYFGSRWMISFSTANLTWPSSTESIHWAGINLSVLKTAPFESTKCVTLCETSSARIFFNSPILSLVHSFVQAANFLARPSNSIMFCCDIKRIINKLSTILRRLCFSFGFLSDTICHTDLHHPREIATMP